MKTPLTTLLLLGLLAGCDNGSDDASNASNASNASGPSVEMTGFGEEVILADGSEVVPVVDGGVGERDPVENIEAEMASPGAGASEPVITVDNHVELLGNVFAIFSAGLYGDDLLTAPDYSDPFFDGKPEIGDDGNPISPPVNIVCGNGGAASFVPENDGLVFDSIAAWNFEFDSCQDGERLLDGDLRREIFESITLASSGFSSESQALLKRFSGTLQHTLISGSAFLYTTDMNFSLTGPMNVLSISDSTTRLNTDRQFGRMSGGFTVSADWTNGQPVAVLVTEEFAQDEDPGLEGRGMKFESGRIELVAGADNRLVLTADTGDLDTVEITIAAAGASETFVSSWEPWSARFYFESESGY